MNIPRDKKKKLPRYLRSWRIEQLLFSFCGRFVSVPFRGRVIFFVIQAEACSGQHSSNHAGPHDVLPPLLQPELVQFMNATPRCRLTTTEYFA